MPDWVYLGRKVSRLKIRVITFNTETIKKNTRLRFGQIYMFAILNFISSVGKERNHSTSPATIGSSVDFIAIMLLTQNRVRCSSEMGCHAQRYL
jgi:hypothetical protein